MKLNGPDIVMHFFDPYLPRNSSIYLSFYSITLTNQDKYLFKIVLFLDNMSLYIGSQFALTLRL